MNELQAKALLQAEYDRPGGDDFGVEYGIHREAPNATKAGEWLIDVHDCDEYDAYTFSLAWVEQVENKLHT